MKRGKKERGTVLEVNKKEGPLGKKGAKSKHLQAQWRAEVGRKERTAPIEGKGGKSD